MNKEAIAAKSLLKMLAGGATAAGLVGGSGYLGHKMGYKSGATKATNEMASAFSEANARENRQIVDSFKLFNKKENAALASNYMRRGMALGAELHANGKIKTPAEMAAMAKTSSDEIYNKAFNDEIEKLALHPLLSAGAAVAKRLLRRGVRKGKVMAGRAGQTYRGMDKGQRRLVQGAAVAGAGTGYALS